MKTNKIVTLFLGNVLIGVIVVYLPDCLLFLSLLKYRGVGTFFKNKNKKWGSQIEEAP